MQAYNKQQAGNAKWDVQSLAGCHEEGVALLKILQSEEGHDASGTPSGVASHDPQKTVSVLIWQCAVMQECKWQEARVVETLWSLLKEGIAMVDDQGPGGQRLYWFPCLESSGAAQGEVVP